MEKTFKVSAGRNHMNREIKAMLGLLSYRECEILDVQTPPNLLISCYDEMGTSETVCLSPMAVCKHGFYLTKFSDNYLT